MIPVEIEENENKAEIVFDTDFYDQYWITEVCEEFKDVCKIKVTMSKNKEHTRVELKPKVQESVEKIAYRFSNFVLHKQAGEI